MLENEIKELTAAVRENTETMKQMIAGREEALAALTAKDGAGTTTTTTTTRRGRKPKDDAGTDAGTAAAAAAPSWNPDLSDAGVRAAVSPYLNVEDPEQKKANAGNVRAVLQHLGADVLLPVATKPEAKALADDDAKRQAVFFITRFREGLTVDFNADYDFNSDPLAQGNLEPAAEPAAEEDDLLG